MNAVITMAIGERFSRMYELTGGPMREYARRIGADFDIIRTASPLANITRAFEKFQIQQFLKKYDRIIYLDADVVVKDSCPDLFDIVPDTYIGAFLEVSPEMMDDGCSRRMQKHMRKAQQLLGEIGWTTDYFNAGVMVVGQAHKPAFNIPAVPYIGPEDQTQLNYNVKVLDIPVHDLSDKYNCMVYRNALGCPVIGEEHAQILHYAGAVPWVRKMQDIQAQLSGCATAETIRVI